MAQRCKNDAVYCLVCVMCYTCYGILNSTYCATTAVTNTGTACGCVIDIMNIHDVYGLRQPSITRAGVPGSQCQLSGPQFVNVDRQCTCPVVQFTSV